MLMWGYVWPILLVIGANTVYNICTKSVPGEVNSFASLFVTYLVGAGLSLAMFFLTAEGKNFWMELRKINWASFLLGVSVVALEFGYICIYRAGWKVSVGSLVANIGLAAVLLLVGVLLYRETLSIKQLVGMGLCAAGLILVNK